MIQLKKDFKSSSLTEWIEQLKKELKGDDFNKLLREDELEELTHPTFSHQESKSGSIEIPGSFPFTRGYKSKNNNWNNGYLLKVTDEKAANSKALDVLLKGCDSLVFDFQNKTEINWQMLLNEIELEFIQSEFRFTVIQQFTSLKNHFKNNLPSSIKFSFDFLTLDNSDQLLDTISEEMKATHRPFCFVDGFSIQQCGATTWQEVAFMLTTGHHYLYSLIKNGYTVNEAVESIHFSTGIGANYFYEIAKIRAFRKGWAAIINQYDPKNLSTDKCSITGIVGLMNKSLLDPHTNLLRQTTEVMSAVSAGIETIVVLPYDSQSTKGTSILAERMALNISLILKEESYFNAVIDPLGGSYSLEDLTTQIGEKSWALFQNLEKSEGIFSLETLTDLKSQISLKAEIRKNQVLNNQKTIIGINKFINPNTENNYFVNQNDYLGMSKINFESDLKQVK